MSENPQLVGLEKALASATEHDFIIMSGPRLIYGVDSRGNHGFLHLDDKYLVGTVTVFPLRLAKRTIEFTGGDAVSYKNFLQFHIDKLKQKSL